MTREIKLKLMLYALISAVTFYLFAGVPNASIGVPVFAVIQAICLYFCAPDKKVLIKFIPIIILCTNSFVSASPLWTVPNFVVCGVLYGCMFTDFSFKDTEHCFLSDILRKTADAISKIDLPFVWFGEFQEEKSPIIKKFAFAALCSIICAIVLVAVLSGADMVFDSQTRQLIEKFQSHLNISTCFFVLVSVGVGLYLFGIVCNSYDLPRPKFETKYTPEGDLILINTLLITAISIYTIFAAIQFKYLFAGSTLPDGLSYATYARKGFFELLGLSCVNIASIITVVYFIRSAHSKWVHLSVVMCCYLCVVTMVLLASSYYRLTLYTDVYGLTRLRLFVMGFLFFEALGLAITFVYIIKPKFNIILIYGAIALLYYVVLNIVPTDYIIAKTHTDDYIKNGTPIPEYVVDELSADAAPAMGELFRNTDDPKIKKSITRFFTRNVRTPANSPWQSYNLSKERCKNIYDSLY